jgi:hypothetical protein
VIATRMISGTGLHVTCFGGRHIVGTDGRVLSMPACASLAGAASAG